MVSNIGVNFASRFIPIILQECKDVCSQWKGKVELVDQTSLLTFNVIAKILFGEDVNSLIGLCTHKNPLNGVISELPVRECFNNFLEESATVYGFPWNAMFKTLIEKGILRQNSWNDHNLRECYRVVREFL